MHDIISFYIKPQKKKKIVNKYALKKNKKCSQ